MTNKAFAVPSVAGRIFGVFIPDLSSRAKALSATMVTRQSALY